MGVIIYRPCQAFPALRGLAPGKEQRVSPRGEFPDQPVVGVGGVIISEGRALLIRRGSEPLRGAWSIPGGRLELGETIAQGVARELLEETNLEVRVLDLIEVFERIFREDSSPSAGPRYHYVILDYLCEMMGGEPRPGSDVTDLAWAREEELPRFGLTPTATRILLKAFEMARRTPR